MIKRIDELKEPPIIGEEYLVPVFSSYIDGKIRRAPLILHLHNDKENDQHESHYHVDTRFLDRGNINDKEDWFFFKRIYPHEYPGFFYSYRTMKCQTDVEWFVTHPDLIKKSKVKHDCIYKGKCPHRGYDLSQVKVRDGVITCPLHGLKFDGETKKLIK